MREGIIQFETSSQSWNSLPRASLYKETCPTDAIYRWSRQVSFYKIFKLLSFSGIPAPRLAKCDVPKEKTRLAIMEQIFEAMEKMFQVANIIHGDFSEFNILYFQRRIWVIDVSQVKFWFQLAKVSTQF